LRTVRFETPVRTALHRSPLPSPVSRHLRDKPHNISVSNALAGQMGAGILDAAGVAGP